MARVRLEDTRDWELVHDEQDIRGREVWDEAGHKLGTVEDLVLDTDEQRVAAAVLDTGREVPARDLTIAKDVVYVMGPTPAAGTTATPAGAPAPAFAATAHPPAHAAERRAYDEYSGLRRREAVEAPPPPPPAEAAPPSRAEAPPPPRHTEAPPQRAEAPRSESTSFVDYADFSDDFHRHYDDTFGHLQRRYSDYEPAYRFGYDMAYDDRYDDRDFTSIESDLRQAYYRRHGYPMSDPHVWNDVREAVRHAFARARGRV